MPVFDGLAIAVTADFSYQSCCATEIGGTDALQVAASLETHAHAGVGSLRAPLGSTHLTLGSD